jgi:hypothetical protein
MENVSMDDAVSLLTLANAIEVCTQTALRSVGGDLSNKVDGQRITSDIVGGLVASTLHASIKK